MEIKDIKVIDFSEENKEKLSKLPAIKNIKGSFITQVRNYINQLKGL